MIENSRIILDTGNIKGYLDSASSSLTPAPVLEVMDNYYRICRANVHRGLYPASDTATTLFEDARQKVATFIGASTLQVIFTPGATWSANMLYRAIEDAHLLTNTDVILTSVMEHHAQMVPLQQLSIKTGATLTHIPLRGGEIGLDMEKAVGMITPKVKLIALTLASNVTGVINDVAEIAREVRAGGNAIVVVDATSAMGHIPVDVKALGADAVFFSGHKMLGPTGTGVLWMSDELIARIPPSIFGGHMVTRVDLQDAEFHKGREKFEAGTPNIAGVIGLGRAVEYLAHIGVSNIHTYTQGLVKEAQEKLATHPAILKLYSAPSEHNVGIVSFTLKGVHPHDAAEILGRHGVAVRAGHHCAMPYHDALDIPATCRVSFHAYNTKNDITMLLAGLDEVVKIFHKDA